MTDRADKIARDIADDFIIGGMPRKTFIDVVAAALRSYADERLEEAARILDASASFDRKAAEGRDTEEAAAEWRARAVEADECARDVRSLKSQPAEGKGASPDAK